MTPDGTDGERRRRRLVALLVDTGPDDPGNGSAVAGTRARLQRICAIATWEAGVSGAGIAVVDPEADAGGRVVARQVCASGARTASLEDLQLGVGEGPSVDAATSGMPVLVGELALETARWPDYGPAALAGGTAAVFSLPLQVGAVRLGTLDLNRDTAGPLPALHLAAALVLAGLATEALLELVGDPEASTPDVDGARAGVGEAETLATNLGWLAAAHAQVHQASGMISARTGVGIPDALVFMRASAIACDVPIAEIARRIVAREHVVDDDA